MCRGMAAADSAGAAPRYDRYVCCLPGAHASQEITMNVEELMSRNAKTCSSTDHLGKAARLMWDHDIGCVPVVDERGHATGIVTDRDLCMAALLKERELTAIRVGTVMAR